MFAWLPNLRNRNKSISPQCSVFFSVEGSKSFIQLPMTQETEIVIGSLGTENGFDGCIKDLRLNGRVLPLEKSDDVAIVAKYKGRYL